MSGLSEDLRRLLLRLAGRAPSAEDERVMELFRNRAELKKELNALDDERHRLLDKLKLQEGATLRVEEQLAGLEQYLGRPEEGHKSLAYFQLRALWRAAARRLEQFSAELTRQQRDRERRVQVAAFERDKRARMADVEREIVEARVLSDQLGAEQKLAQQQLQEMRGFWNYFRRRALSDGIAARAVRIEAAQIQVTDLSDRLHEIESEPPPAYEGLGVEGRRAINLAVIAYAESLCDRLWPGGLADLARQSTLKRVYDASYGTREQCEALMQRAAKAIADLDRMQDDLPDIKSRTDRLRRSATYLADGDVVPVQDSIRPPEDAAVRGRYAGNVLLEEYWDVYKALVR